MVFCHNDVQAGNILVRHEPGNADERLMLIDFEYCGYNYRAFDIANHFSEWMYDYTNKKYPYFFSMPGKFPSKDTQVS